VSVREKIARVILVLLVAAVPGGVWFYQQVVLPGNYPDHARIVNLTGIARSGKWTTEPVAGWNYWWKEFAHCDTLEFQAGTPVVLRVTSADVLHSFALPGVKQFRRPVDIPAGQWITFRWTPEDPQQQPFLCWQVCSPDHENMRGMIEITGKEKYVEQGG